MNAALTTLNIIVRFFIGGFVKTARKGDYYEIRVAVGAVRNRAIDAILRANGEEFDGTFRFTPKSALKAAQALKAAGFSVMIGKDIKANTETKKVFFPRPETEIGCDTEYTSYSVHTSITDTKEKVDAYIASEIAHYHPCGYGTRAQSYKDLGNGLVAAVVYRSRSCD